MKKFSLEDIQTDKFNDEFHYLAFSLIFGPNPKNISNVEGKSIYNLDVFKKYKELRVAEVSQLDPGTGRLEIERNLKIKKHVSLAAKHVQISSKIAKVITFNNIDKKIHISDAIFTDAEFDLFNRDFIKMLNSRIVKISFLIKAIFYGSIDDVPLLINEFPNISGILLNSKSFLEAVSGHDS